jgi:REP element-mobilizing transposase RayT
MKPTPIYATDHCKAAFQLRWSLALFLKQPPPPVGEWLPTLQVQTERDRIKILEARQNSPLRLQFLLSTQPDTIPWAIIKSIKGRLQHTLRPRLNLTFRRNFRLTSVGESNLEVTQNYVAKQIQNHPLACSLSQVAMARFQRIDKSIDLAVPTHSSHGQYLIALHIVFVHSGRWRTADNNFHKTTEQAILTTAAKYQERISRLSILADHMHLTIGISHERSPATVALSYMNNIAHRHGMNTILMPSYYVGTIGPFNMNVIRKALL